MGPTTTLTLAAVLGALVAVALVAARARRPLRGGLGLADVAVPGAAAAGPVLVGLVGVLARGVDSRTFTVVHAAYLGLVVVVPALGVALGGRRLVARRAGVAVVDGSRLPARWRAGADGLLVVLLVVPAPIGWYATHVVPYDLRVDRAEVDLPAARAGRDPIRVGVLADLQTARVGPAEEHAITTLLDQRPDVILVAGDLFQGNADQRRAVRPAMRRLLGRLHARGGVYVVQGDSELHDVMDDLLVGTGIQVLDDRAVEVRVGDRRVLIGGNRLRWAPEVGVALRDRLQAADPSVVRILLAHRPDVVLGLPPSAAVDLTVAGHTHGGQVSLPLVGPLVTFSKVPRAVAAGGLHEVDGNRIYVSTGVGLVRQQAPQVRFGARPSVGLVTLR